VGLKSRARQSLISAACHLPELFFLIVEAQKPISRIVALAAIGAGKKAAQMRTPAIKVL
jgi:hypothetical protein